MSKRALGPLLWSLGLLFIGNPIFLLLVPGIGFSLVRYFAIYTPQPIVLGSASADGGTVGLLRAIALSWAISAAVIALSGSLAVWLLRTFLPEVRTWLNRQTPWRLTLYRTIWVVAGWVIVTSAVIWHGGHAPGAPSWTALLSLVPFLLWQGFISGAAWGSPDPRIVRPITLLGPEDIRRTRDRMVSTTEGRPAEELPPAPSAETDAEVHPADGSDGETEEDG